jgi:hypothetical protein
VTVTADSGRQLRTQIGSAPAEAVAKMLLRALHEQKRG